MFRRQYETPENTPIYLKSNMTFGKTVLAVIVAQILMVLVGMILFGIMVNDANANPDVPAEQQDGCDHGATGRDCKPDPQPDKGKDCEVHGRNDVGGVNEDHCLNIDTTTTTVPTTVTTVPETTTTTVVVPTTPTTVSTDTQVPPADVVKPESTTSTTSTCDVGTFVSCPGQPHGGPGELAELPRTGMWTNVLLALGAWFVIAGLASLFLGKFIANGRGTDLR